MKGSMFSTEIAEPYAQALMSLAQSQNLTNQLGDELRSLLDLMENSPELQGFINNPIVQEADQKAILHRIMGDNANPYFVNFLRLLVDKHRLIFLPEIGRQYLELLRKLNNTVLAEVTSATELNEQQRQAVAEKVKSLTGAAAVELKIAIDPDLIGGVTIKVGSQAFDASIRGQLRRIGYSLGITN